MVMSIVNFVDYKGSAYVFCVIAVERVDSLRF